MAHEEVEHAASRLQRRFLRKTEVFLRVSQETISRITDKVIEEKNDWALRPLEFPIARLHYTKTTGLWTLYWRDRNQKYHRYAPLDPSPQVQDLLDYLDGRADPHLLGLTTS